MTLEAVNILNSDMVFDLIETIANTPGKNDKIALLKGAIDNMLVERVLAASYDPYTTYGIKKPLAFVLEGEGHFNKDTWQILDDLASRKLTGNAAIDRLREELGRLTEKSALLLWRIIIKDMKAGFGESSINKAKKGLIKTFPYQRCSLTKDADLDSWNWDDGVISQEKADGMFANVDNEESGVVNISSRQGSQFPSDKFPGIVEDMQTRMTQGLQYHGEIVVYRDGELCERQIGNGIINHVLNGGDFAENEVPKYMVWDSIPLEYVKPKGKFTTPYIVRLKGILADLKAKPGSHISLIATRTVRSLDEALSHCAELIAEGKEGTIIKHPEAIWKDGKSKEQIKLKLEVDVDLVIVGINQGKAGSRIEGRAGAFACETSDGLLRVDVTIKNEAMRDSVDSNPDEWIGSIIVVRANQLLKPSESNDLHSLFLPRMAETHYRTDKHDADSLQQVKDQFESAIKGK